MPIETVFECAFEMGCPPRARPAESRGPSRTSGPRSIAGSALPATRARHLSVTVVLLAILGAAACGGTGSGPAVEVPRVDAPPQSGLVWTRTAAGEDRTWWVRLDGSPLAGQPIDGPLWADGDALWQMHVEPVEVPVWDGDEEPGESDPPSPDRTATMRRVVLRDLVADARVVVLEAPAVGGVQDASHEVWLDGSVGPYLFFRDRLSVFAWGAHGSEEMRALVWDLRAAAPAEVATERELEAWGPDAIERARALEHADEDADVRLVAFHPRWSLDGLTVELQAAASSCYACGDNEWTDYSVSVRIPLPEPPERLAMPLPAWAREAAARDGGTLMGFTLVEDPAPARILDSLSR